MANLASAKKRIRQNERARMRNQARKSRLKTETRRFLDALHEGDLTGAQEQFRVVVKKLDQTAAKGTLHARTVARRKSRLARRLNVALAAKSG
ncbi:MAG: 30S ribosomal protein S20 [Planctomycetes bacterium]|nr:30S ribosomal protein S20 [Planctomycetota bacterium]